MTKTVNTFADNDQVLLAIRQDRKQCTINEVIDFGPNAFGFFNVTVKKVSFQNGIKTEKITTLPYPQRAYKSLNEDQRYAWQETVLELLD